MSEQPYSDADLAWAMRVMAQYQHAAKGLMEQLLDSYRGSKPEVASQIARDLMLSQNTHVLLMLLGQLTMRVAKAEKLAQEAHGPMVTVAELGYTPEEAKPDLWQTAAQDQIEAASAAGDHRLAARLAVDGQVRSTAEDLAKGYDFDHLLRAMGLMPQPMLVLVSAEMLHRLSEQYLKGGAQHGDS